MSDRALLCPRHTFCCLYILAAVQLVIGFTVRDCSRCCDTPQEARHHIRHLSIYVSLFLFLSTSLSPTKDFVPCLVYSMMTLDRLIPQQESLAMNVSLHM